MKLLLMCLAALIGGCATVVRVPLTEDQVVGSYSAPILITWAHVYKLHKDGKAEYLVAYDSFEEQPDGTLKWGHSYVGRWRLASPTEVVVWFEAEDGKIDEFVLRSVATRSGPALVQISPKGTIDGYSGELALTFRRQTNQD